MLKNLARSLSRIALAAVVTVAFVSCTGGGETDPNAGMIKYRCLTSSCSYTVMLPASAPVPEHCGKKMIQ